jgi:hypothetical protein
LFASLGMRCTMTDQTSTHQTSGERHGSAESLSPR